MFLFIFPPVISSKPCTVFYVVLPLHFNLYKPLPKFVNSAILLKLNMFWCFISSPIHSHLSFKNCSIAVSLHVLIIYAFHSLFHHVGGNFLSLHLSIYLLVSTFPINTMLTQMSFTLHRSIHIQFSLPLLVHIPV
jgi:hypothetical protein